MSFKPMLAVEADLTKVKYPVAVSPKLDGVRAIVINGVVMSRKLKPIPNKHVQSLFGKYEGYDGELIFGDPTDPAVFRETTSAVMSIEGAPDVHFYVFDTVLSPSSPWIERYKSIVPEGNVVKLQHRLAPTASEVTRLQEEWVGEGFEGLMIRDINGRYKFGRSTANEGLLLKVKSFTDAEFKVIGFAERLHNGNEATVDELGHTKRSSHSENKTGRGDLGALVLEGSGFTFSCGTGFTDEERAEIWANRDAYLGRLAKVKYFEGGVKDAPRFPVFLGFREEMDV